MPHITEISVEQNSNTVRYEKDRHKNDDKDEDSKQEEDIGNELIFD